MKKLGLKGKLITAFLFAGLVPMIGVGFYTYQQSKVNLEEQAVERLKAIRDVKKRSVERYFETVQEQVLTLSDDVGVKEAMIDFSKSFNDVITENNYTKADILSFRSALKKFYVGEFGKKYNSENEATINASKLLNSLTDIELVHQYHYIANNSNELGAKDGLNYSADRSTYSKYHAKYHASIRHFLSSFKYYDVFLVDHKSGNVVYSVCNFSYERSL
jgi:methyl-accepting chemotaxis protein